MKRYIYLLILLVLASCEAIPETEFTDRPVVCCYLSDRESPVLTVQKLIPFQSDAEFSEEDISDLTITITDQTSGKEYLLSCTEDGTYGNPELIVSSGHEYKLYYD